MGDTDESITMILLLCCSVVVHSTSQPTFSTKNTGNLHLPWWNYCKEEKERLERWMVFRCDEFYYFILLVALVHRVEGGDIS